MPEKNQTQIEFLDARRLPVRIGLIAAILAAIVFGWFAIRWQLGNMLAELTVPTEANAKNIGLVAQRFAPGDALATWLVASTETSEKPETSLADFEKTVRLAPYDYRWWVELGRAREQSAAVESSEAAYLRAVRLAPEYSYPHWQLGNFYLRRERSEEAFAELKKAAQNNVIYRQQVFSIAWDFYDQDTAKIEEIAGNFPDAKVGLAQFYAVKQRAADSLRVWNTLTDEEKQKNQAVGKLVAQILFDKKHFRSAVEFVSQLGIEPKAEAEAVQNGGFEDAIGTQDATYFGWKVSTVEKMNVNLDASHKHGGNRSLRVSFNGFSNAQLHNVLQIVTVEPGGNYRLRFWLKTEDLRSGGTPVLEILEANESRIIASSKPFPSGSNDWQEIVIEFTADKDSEAVFIRTARAYCGDACPIYGAIWYDDFKLEKRS